MELQNSGIVAESNNEPEQESVGIQGRPYDEGEPDVAEEQDTTYSHYLAGFALTVSGNNAEAALHRHLSGSRPLSERNLTAFTLGTGDARDRLVNRETPIRNKSAVRREVDSLLNG